MKWYRQETHGADGKFIRRACAKCQSWSHTTSKHGKPPTKTPATRMKEQLRVNLIITCPACQDAVGPCTRKEIEEFITAHEHQERK